MDCLSFCPSSVPSSVTLASTCGGATLMVFMTILETFIRKQCDLEDPCNRVISPEKPLSRYDFVVIGGGSAGSAAASRLSENGCYSVLLLEAGLDEPAWTQVPSFFFNYLHSDLDWQYETEPEENACLNNKDQKCYWGRGKVLGGTSVVNGMMYMRGSKKDYDNWEKLGNKGWSYQDVLPFFIKSENNFDTEMDYGYHGVGGPLPVSRFLHHVDFGLDILKAGNELGYRTGDLNGRNHTGFAIAQTTSFGGARFSSAKAFVRPAAARLHFHVLLNSTATKIIFDDQKKAVAVEFFRNGTLHRVGVDKEVVVSGGAVNSPQILLNSGVGPKEELEAVKVPVVHDLPGVGKNLHNHVSYSVDFSINETETGYLNFESTMEYLLSRKGLLSGTGISEVTAMINTKYANSSEDHPDIQMIFGGYLAADCSATGMKITNSTARRIVNFVPTLLHIKSKGYLRLRDNNPLSKPMISPKYLSHPDDIGALIEGIKFAIRLAETDALKKYDMQLDKTPVKNCEHLEFGSDPYWECAVKHKTNPENHQAGSCKMGSDSDPLAVLDHELRVRGVKGVRVADTSVMPDVVSGNTNAPAIMIGERVAHFIKGTWANFTEKCYSQNPQSPLVQDINIEGFIPQRFDPLGLNPQGFNPQGFNPQGLNPEGLNPEGFNPEGLNPQGSYPQGLNPQGLNPPVINPEGLIPQGTQIQSMNIQIDYPQIPNLPPAENQTSKVPPFPAIQLR